MPFYFCLFALWPVAEIFVFILVAQEIGIFSAFILGFLAALVGGIMIRNQGLAILMSLNGTFRQNKKPSDAVFNSLCIAIAGLLFMIPGFLSDVMAITLLLPPMREYIKRSIAWSESGGAGPAGSDVLEGEFERIEEARPQITRDNA